MNNKYLDILKSELIPAMGCTEPIALAYIGASLKALLKGNPNKVKIKVSGNLIKNVKSVIVPNTDGLKGIEAAVACGIIAGKEDKCLEVIKEVKSEDITKIKTYLNDATFKVEPMESNHLLDIKVIGYLDNNKAEIRICDHHTNIIYKKYNDEIIYQIDNQIIKDIYNYEFMNVNDIYEFSNNVDIKDIKAIIERAINYNMAIAKEGLINNYGANIGKVILQSEDSLKAKAKAYAASASDARMAGCNMPVIINSGSGNQGLTITVPICIYANELKISEEKLYRSLTFAHLLAIHLKSGIGKLSAYCGAVSAGCASVCGIAYLLDEDYKCITHTLVNSLAISSGIICDGAKASCAAKIAQSLDAGFLGYEMYKNNQEFKDGDGIVVKGVENTIKNIYRLGKIGMQFTDVEIIKMMTNC